jgi:hypothetical protein
MRINKTLTFRPQNGRSRACDRPGRAGTAMSPSPSLPSPLPADAPVIVVRSETDLLSAQAHPKILQAYRHWCSLRPGEQLPGRQHIDPFALRSLLPSVWLADLTRDPLRLRYRLAGTSIVAGLGREVTGMWLDEAHPRPESVEIFVNRTTLMIDAVAPTWRRGASQLWQHDVWARVENLIMPLAADGRTIDMLFGVNLFYSDRGVEIL